MKLPIQIFTFLIASLILNGCNSNLKNDLDYDRVLYNNITLLDEAYFAYSPGYDEGIQLKGKIQKSEIKSIPESCSLITQTNIQKGVLAVEDIKLLSDICKQGFLDGFNGSEPNQKLYRHIN